MFIISFFENFMAEHLILASFIPIVIGMGGNIGTQSSTIIVRGLATGHVNINEFYKVILKEVRVGITLGIIYGSLLGCVVTLFIYQWINWEVSIQYGLTVGFSIFLSMLIGCAVASFIPILLYKINKDPAIATGPFVTTAIDVLGVIMYFIIASLLL